MYAICWTNSIANVCERYVSMWYHGVYDMMIVVALKEDLQSYRGRSEYAWSVQETSVRLYY